MSFVTPSDCRFGVCPHPGVCSPQLRKDAIGCTNPRPETLYTKMRELDLERCDGEEKCTVDKPCRFHWLVKVFHSMLQGCTPLPEFWGVPQYCTRHPHHAGPCNGFPKMTCQEPFSK